MSSRSDTGYKKINLSEIGKIQTDDEFTEYAVSWNLSAIDKQQSNENSMQRALYKYYDQSKQNMIENVIYYKFDICLRDTSVTVKPIIKR